MSRAEKPALPQDVVKRIVEEEKLRLQVREELERSKKSDYGSKAWTFLNSSFGLFLLTSIFVTGLGSLFTRWTERVKEREARTQEEKRLLAEFDFRLNELETRIDQIGAASDADDKGMLTVYIWRAARGTPDFQPAVPEFKNVHWADLIIQLDGLGISDNSAEAIGATRDLENLEGGVATLTSKGYHVFPANYLEQREKVLRTYSEKAWKRALADHTSVGPTY